ncbi:o-methyltransferase [Drepanopeziza brunnea f. sp. 'multigermtubi' MB_m1]|uniref:O-methyltransferase n=1 Tax=Marssonina brunnea f. sp. multigermtubi (strain MB_m1) TaxID=1072389 RepID=K1WFY3_MARBU|nr:o-methyltransferase [Drepanopeziza brunnea f. sp. 'multigermtubi' MB_m1]EKD16415.1 o-methyltransferase [Drepanopeziza brunnea f. sp. 'multigermtubi' MB_m1]
MSNTAGGSPPAPPIIAPSVSTLDALSGTIQASIARYDKAKTLHERAVALQEIQLSSSKLCQATTPYQQLFAEINFRPNLNVAIRIGVEMGLFKALPTSGEPSTIADLAQKTNSEEEFLLRIARTVAAFNIIHENDSSKDSLPSYSHTPYSRFLTSPPAEASTRHLFDEMLHAQTNSAVDYYLKNGFRNPTDAKNSPFSFAHGETDKGVFDILEEHPEKMRVFNSAMTIVSIIETSEKFQAYPFDRLSPNKEGVVLVDVGGGKGHVINQIRSAFPNLQGKFALEDMQVVLDGGTVVPADVVLQPHDIFKEAQPIQGKIFPKLLRSNYFLKSILHDWPDSSCLQILANLKTAMRGSPTSRLLICELVLPDRNPSASQVLRDINMLVIAGKERSKSQWNKLLGEAGYEIMGFYGSESANSGIIEARLRQ